MILAGISFRVIFPNTVSPPGFAACAFSVSSAMLAQAADLVSAAFSDVKQNERSLANNRDDAAGADWSIRWDFLRFRK